MPISSSLILYGLIAILVGVFFGNLHDRNRGCLTAIVAFFGCAGGLVASVFGFWHLLFNWKSETLMYSTLFSMVDLTPYAYFALFTPLWFLLLLCTVVLSICALDKESDWGLYSVLIAFFVISGVFGDFNILTHIWNHPLVCLGAIGLYLLAGACWAFAKWVMYVDERALEYEDFTREWLNYEGIEGTVVPENLKAKFTKALLSDSRWSYYTGIWKNGDKVKKPRPYPVWHENKARATRWIIIWPLSMFWSFFDDLLRSVVRKMVAYMANLADAIVRRRFKGWENNIQEEEISE